MNVYESGRSKEERITMKIFPFTALKIEGESMLPDLHPGDFIAVNRWAYILHSPKIGDAVAAKDPRNEKRIMIKRVSGVKQEQIFLQGINGAHSTDSRTFGFVSRNKVVGKVFLCFSGNRKQRMREVTK
jgi:nickel-type superoxide dismutase maturation protease